MSPLDLTGFVCQDCHKQVPHIYTAKLKWGFTENWDTFQTDTKHCLCLGISSQVHVIILKKKCNFAIELFIPEVNYVEFAVCIL